MPSMDSIVGLIAPHDCLVCGQEGDLLCRWCAPDVLDSLPSRCFMCHAQTIDFATCDLCRRKSVLSHVWIRTEYSQLPKQLVHVLKFGRAKAAAAVIAQQMAGALPYLPVETIVTHIPTATSRRRQRGYDQAELIARQLAAMCNLQHVTLLVRHGHARQVGANRKVRLSQMQSVFRAQKVAVLQGKTVLVIDDVMTTGATLEAAASTLRQAGAKKLFASTFAHKR